MIHEWQPDSRVGGQERFLENLFKETKEMKRTGKEKRAFGNRTKADRQMGECGYRREDGEEVKET